MASSYTSRLSLRKPATGETGWGPVIDANLDQIDGLAAVGQLGVAPAAIDTATGLSTSLNIKVAEGTFINSAGAYVSFAAAGSFAMTSSATNAVWLTDSGVLTKGSVFPSPGTKIVRLAIVITGLNTITSITDARVPFMSAG